jgi:hypothetical protein
MLFRHDLHGALAGRKCAPKGEHGRNVASVLPT